MLVTLCCTSFNSQERCKSAIAREHQHTNTQVLIDRLVPKRPTASRRSVQSQYEPESLGDIVICECLGKPNSSDNSIASAHRSVVDRIAPYPALVDLCDIIGTPEQTEKLLRQSVLLLRTSDGRGGAPIVACHCGKAAAFDLASVKKPIPLCKLIALRKLRRASHRWRLRARVVGWQVPVRSNFCGVRESANLRSAEAASAVAAVVAIV